MRKCFISFKKEDRNYKNYLVEKFDKDYFIDKSLDEVIDSEDGDYVMQVIREKYLRDSTVTIFLIGSHSSENEGRDYLGDKNYFIKRELRASLHNGKGNTRNGILGVVLPEMYTKIFKGSYSCVYCNGSHNYVNINDTTVIREFSYNYYVEPHEGCSWTEDERYCVLVKWDDFLKDVEHYIEQAFEKRSSPIVDKVRVNIKR